MLELKYYYNIFIVIKICYNDTLIYALSEHYYMIYILILCKNLENKTPLINPIFSYKHCMTSCNRKKEKHGLKT